MLITKNRLFATMELFRHYCRNHRAKRDELEHKLKHGAGNMENIEIMTPESDFCWGIKITGYIYMQ